MSYVEHGPRIFLAGRPNSGIPLTYGDYVLPRKRLEGRLKLYDSCSDIRAWSSNSLENSRYFRELNEHGSPIGKIIPVNVVVDNIIRLNSRTQSELQIVKRELQKYKNLKLTPKQKEQLQNLDYNPKIKESVQSNHVMGSLVNVGKSVPLIYSNSCLSVYLPIERNFRRNKDRLTLVNQSSQFYPHSLTAFDIQSSMNNYTLVSQFKSVPKPRSTGDYIENTPHCVEYVDIALQVEQEMHDIGIQFDGQVDKCSNKIITASAISQTSFIYKSSEESNNVMEPDKISFRTSNYEEESFESRTSRSESSQDIGTSSESSSEITESNFNINNSIHKRIIIQKDSEIIVLKNELCVRDVELDEMRGFNERLQISLKQKEDYINTQQENLKTLSDKLRKVEHERNCAIENLKSELHSSTYLINQLKQELSKKYESCYLQSQEIEELKLCATKKLQIMEQLAQKAEKYDLIVDQLKKALYEKDDLAKQNYEQSCILADQEEEIKRLLTLISETSVTYEEQEKTKRMLESLKTEIDEKTIKISEYKQQLLLLKRETGDFVNSLKHALNNLEEFNGLCEDVYNCVNNDLDIAAETNNLLYNINCLMTRFQSYKIERQHLLQQIENLKQSVGDDKQQIYFNQNLKNIISDILNCEPEADSKNINAKDSIIVLNVRQNKYNPSEIEFEDISNSANSENSFNGMADNGCHNYIIKLNKKNNISEIDKEILEYFSHFMVKLHSLTQKLQVYLEVERPFMIKQIYNFYDVLKDTESAINDSQDLSLKKERILKLCNLFNEKHKKYNSYITQLPNDLSQIQLKIIEFVKTILYELLNTILYAEKNNLSDKQINCAFEIYFKSFIDRISIAIQGAGDQHVQIIEEIEKQQQELDNKNEEIVRLKEEVAQYLGRKGDGDGIHSEENNAAFKEQLTKIMTELSVKDEFILKLEEQHQILKTELCKCHENYNVLQSQNKNLHNIRNKLLKECQKYKKELEIKNTELVDLQKLHNVFDENILLNKKLKIAENKLSEMNQTILSLTEQNDKIDVIYLLQEDLVKLDKSEKKLKTELSNLKTQLVNDQNKIKNLDNNLNAFEHENENLKQNVEYWKNENSELSHKLYTEAIEEKLRNKLYTLSNKVHERISNFNKQLVSKDYFDESLKDKYLIYQKINEDLKPSENWKKETKENEIEEIQNQQLLRSINIKNKILENDYTIFQQLNSVDEDILNVRYTINPLEIRDNENQNSSQKLRNQIESKNSEMKNLQDIISRLTEENTDLKLQIDQFQDKIISMKNVYDSSWNALYKSHKQKVDTLQKQFEDEKTVMNDGRTFDLENWLQSLDMKKLAELYERITIIMDNNSDFITTKNEHQHFYETDIQKEFYGDFNKTQKVMHTNIYEKEISNKLDLTRLREQSNSHLQSQWQFIISSQTQKYSTQTENYKLNLEEDCGCVNDRKLPQFENECEKEKHAIKDNTFDQQRWCFINQCSAYHKMSNNYNCSKSIYTD
ncbi:uncharacterized protein LOC116429672 isoform X1 [Nomia melanderi]|uniref:uncharacterized protein LOC116429672 isoform X1 n=1 Tax=Nomia melanderi TaxID=2448451 RepID=UPI003FCEC2DA